MTLGSHREIRLHYQLHTGEEEPCRQRPLQDQDQRSPPGGQLYQPRCRTAERLRGPGLSYDSINATDEGHSPRHVDVLGPLPPAGSGRYLLSIVDRSTRWLEATPMSEETTHACAEALLSSWIRRFYVPDDIMTDRGSAFLSEIWLSLANLMGMTLQSTTANNPAANGMVERTHHTFKAALMASCMDEHWKAQFSWLLLGLRTAPRADSEPSPAEKVYGEALTVPSEFFPATTDDTKLDHLREIVGKFRPCLKTYEDRTRNFMPKNLDNCDYVFIRVDAHRQPLTRLYRDPYKVIRRTAKSFLWNIHGQEDWMMIDRLKPAFLESNKKITAGPDSPRIPPPNKSSTKREKTTQRQGKTIPPQQSNPPLRSSIRGELRHPPLYRD
ncbi:uncharacterized protein [Palaemon carinicauda]|uniref:uncharacterized protein n=1 Tax=Palaemon carinicauda TaxID=392227 RepID=UPI0035B69B38